MQGTRWCFTINNPESSLVDDGWSGRVSRAVWQLEMSESGTPHFQGYIVVSRNSRAPAIEVLLGGSAHLELAKGDNAQCVAYCTKEDTRLEGPWWFPDEETVRNKEQGKRSDLLEAARSVIAGKSMRDIDPVVYARNFRGLQALAALHHPPQLRDNVRVLCINGPPGIGKTTLVMTRMASVPFALTVTETGALWGDGYDGQAAVLLDDYAGQLPYHVFNKVCDRWPFQLPVKHGFVPAKWTMVVVLCNVKPCDWYSKYGANLEAQEAVYRRIGYGKWDSDPENHRYVEVESREDLLAIISPPINS